MTLCSAGARGISHIHERIGECQNADFLIFKPKWKNYVCNLLENCIYHFKLWEIGFLVITYKSTDGKVIFKTKNSIEM